MAVLDAEKKKAWKNALRECPSPWIVFGLPSLGLPEDRLGGVAGLIDWLVHGQVSRLLSRGLLEPEEFCLFPGQGKHGNFLLYHYGQEPDVKSFLGRLKKLRVQELSLAESTFSKDFSAKLKQNLQKDGIRCTRLEPDSG
jgi:hypothetical protein